jgi:hypothetical protein
MKLALCAITAVVILGIAYSLGPDLTRYMKIRAM